MSAGSRVRERKELYERLAKRKSREVRSGGGFFASQRPLASPRDTERDSRRKSATSASDLKLQQIQSQDTSSTSINSGKPTVRLVQPSTSRATPAPAPAQPSPSPSPSPSPPSSPSPSPPPPLLSSTASSSAHAHHCGNDGDQAPAAEPQRAAAAADETRACARLRDTSDSEPAFSASSREFGVSESHAPANEAPGTDQEQDRAPSATLYTNTSQFTLARSKSTRRSISSGWGSQCSTLQSGSEIVVPNNKSFRSHSSSQVTTLRGTPTPYDHEDHHARAYGDDATRLSLQTLQEASPELTTIRAVPCSETSTSSPVEPRPGSHTFQDACNAASRPYTAPTDTPTDSGSPASLPTRSRRAYSTGSIHTLPSIPNLRDFTSSPVVQVYGSDPATTSEAAQSQSSSPSSVSCSPSAGSVLRHPVSRPGWLQQAISIESINSRLDQYGTLPAGRHLASHSSWASFDTNDILPPLLIPRRRVRHKPASTSLASQASSQSTVARPRAESPSTDDAMETEEDVDTLPYPRRPFSNHLSTIASESDALSGSHHFSHWSAGSGVLTMGSGDQTPLSATFDGSRRRSAPVDSIASSLPSPPTRRTSTEAGDISLDIFREESAVPQPLFRAQNGPTMVNNPAPSSGNTKRKYDGTLPPLSPVPRTRESDEQFDTLSEMARPSLHQKRSGYSLRTRSNTTSNHSRHQSEISSVESERYSQDNGIFPVWARNFYSGQAQLSSKLSLSSLSTAGRAPPPLQHRRGNSAWTDRSTTSRVGQSYSNEGDVTPTGSHFLPAIFRPRTRRNDSKRKSLVRKSHRSKGSNKSQESNDDRPDSMPILADPLDQPVAYNEEVLPSGQPRWGVLQDHGNEEPQPQPQRTPRHKPLRKYSKQNQWNEMEFPRPMTKDRRSEFSGSLAGGQQPTLAPSKRISQNRLSFWQAPSFTESFDTLIRSRCNRQVLLFTLGFMLPLFWMLAAVLPLPSMPISESELEKGNSLPGSEQDVEHAMMRHVAGDAEQRWRDERTYRKAKWWRMLNRVMSVIGLLVIGAIVALVVVTVR